MAEDCDTGDCAIVVEEDGNAFAFLGMAIGWVTGRELVFDMFHRGQWVWRGVVRWKRRGQKREEEMGALTWTIGIARLFIRLLPRCLGQCAFRE